MPTFPSREELKACFAPFFREHEDGPSFTRDGVRSLARHLSLPERTVMAELLRMDIWPERFRRCRGTFTTEALIRLLSTRVLIAGCGGLGGHVAAMLARTGIGSMVLCDPDVFEESNLNRQLFCTEKTLGLPKAEVCRDGLLSIASYMDITARTVALDDDNLPALLSHTDAVMDCLDSVERKKMLESAAAAAGVPCVQGSVARNEGLILLDRSHSLPFSHVYPDTAAGNREGALMNTHVLTVAGTACLMVTLLMRWLCRDKNDSGKIFHLDLSVPELEMLSVSVRN